MTESEDSAPIQPKAEALNNLVTRIAVAAVLAPAAIGLAYVGGLPWATLVTVVAVGLYAEWLLVVGALNDRRGVIAGGIALLGAGVCLALGRPQAAMGVLGLGLIILVLIRSEKVGWTVAGFAYAAAALVASILVRVDSEHGLAALLLVLLIVWVTDIGGYFFGRGLGGPKLWPRVSPKKTWAGAVGGLLGSLLIAVIFVLLGYGKWLPFLLLAAFLSTVSQLGDLFESAVKRRFGVKDSSHLIPGHGGLLDRLDGYVAAVLFAVLFGALRGGVDGVGQGLMVW